MKTHVVADLTILALGPIVKLMDPLHLQGVGLLWYLDEISILDMVPIELERPAVLRRTIGISFHQNIIDLNAVTSSWRLHLLKEIIDMERIAVFLDYSNVHLVGHDLFASDFDTWTTHVSPRRIAD